MGQLTTFIDKILRQFDITLFAGVLAQANEGQFDLRMTTIPAPLTRAAPKFLLDMVSKANHGIEQGAFTSSSVVCHCCLNQVPSAV